MFTSFITTNWSHGHLQGLLISQQITFCHLPLNQVKRCFSMYDYPLGNVMGDVHVYVEMRWWPLTTVSAPSAAPHTPRSNGSRWWPVPSLRLPQAVARISHSPTTAWPGLTGKEHARLANADILGEISSSGYWELCSLMKFLSIRLVLKTSVASVSSGGNQTTYYLRVWQSDK